MASRRVGAVVTTTACGASRTTSETSAFAGSLFTAAWMSSPRAALASAVALPSADVARATRTASETGSGAFGVGSLIRVCVGEALPVRPAVLFGWRCPHAASAERTGLPETRAR